MTADQDLMESVKPFNLFPGQHSERSSIRPDAAERRRPLLSLLTVPTKNNKRRTGGGEEVEGEGDHGVPTNTQTHKSAEYRYVNREGFILAVLFCCD